VTHADEEQYTIQSVQGLPPAALAEAMVGASTLERGGLAMEADHERNEKEDEGFLQPDPARVDVEAVLDRARARAGAYHACAGRLHEKR
jgi:hypothetical protein